MLLREHSPLTSAAVRSSVRQWAGLNLEGQSLWPLRAVWMETAGLTVLMRAGVPAVHVHTRTYTCIYTRGILKRQVSRYDSRVDLARATVSRVVGSAC